VLLVTTWAQFSLCKMCSMEYKLLLIDEKKSTILQDLAKHFSRGAEFVHKDTPFLVPEGFHIVVLNNRLLVCLLYYIFFHLFALIKASILVVRWISLLPASGSNVQRRLCLMFLWLCFFGHLHGICSNL
jgi:hypothetical protein